MSRFTGQLAFCTGVLLGMYLLPVIGANAALTLVEVPVGSMDSASWPTIDNDWSDDPSDGYTGIGHLVDPSLADGTFAMHDHQYVAPFTPDPTKAIVTYGFNVPTQVNSINIFEHFNGIELIEAYVGNSLGSMSSIGIYLGTAGFGPYPEGSSNVFAFINPFSTLYFQFIVRQTFNPSGYAAYRAIPDVTVSAVPEAGSLLVWGMMLASIGTVAKCRRKLLR